MGTIMVIPADFSEVAVEKVPIDNGDGTYNLIEQKKTGIVNVNHLIQTDYPDSRFSCFDVMGLVGRRLSITHDNDVVTSGTGRCPRYAGFFDSLEHGSEAVQAVGSATTQIGNITATILSEDEEIVTVPTGAKYLCILSHFVSKDNTKNAKMDVHVKVLENQET